MKKFIQTILAGLLVSSFLLTACSPIALSSTPTALPEATRQSNAAISLEDGLGRTVTLKQPAARIISLAPSNTEILFAIGAGSQVVGRDSYSDFPIEAKSVQEIGGPSFGSSKELITKLQPDLILAADINSPDLMAEFEKLGMTVFYLKNPKDISGLFANIETVGQLTGHYDEAVSLVETLKNRVSYVDSTVKKSNSKPKVFYEVDGSDPAKPWTTGPGSFMDTMIKQAGGINAGETLPMEWAQISQEELIIQNPDIILLGDAKFGVTAETVKQRAGWDAIKAVKDNKIIVFDDDLVSRPGPRLVDGLEALAKTIHPELFQ
ncbi:ABC transporter substrate-binding protein [Leptolinea sp. HRD-7]|nr:ABC transporter substrate-binding protein [Leptolinea sp. HRD-7]